MMICMNAHAVWTYFVICECVHDVKPTKESIAHELLVMENVYKISHHICMVDSRWKGRDDITHLRL